MKIVNFISKGFFFLMLLLLQIKAVAQKQQIGDRDYANSQVEMADSFRSSGKIYVVLAVILLIFAGMILYLVLVERKLNKLEKENSK